MVTYGVILFLVGAAAFVGGGLVWAYMARLEFREPRTIICPETLEAARVGVDAAYAARTRFAGHEQWRVNACSRWPEMRDCDQACAPQIPLVGDDRRVTPWAAFALPPRFLRINNPVAMSRARYLALAEQLRPR